MTVKATNDDIVMPSGVKKEDYRDWLEMNGIGYIKAVTDWLAKNCGGKWENAGDSFFNLPTSTSVDNDALSWTWLKTNFLQGDIKTFLDVGCGVGQFAIALARAREFSKWHITGTDASMGMIEFAQGLKSKFLVKNVDFDYTDALNLPYKDKQFDVVFSKHVLEHLPSTFLALKEQKRVGRIVVGFAPINEVTGNTEHIFELTEPWIKDCMNRLFKKWDTTVFVKSKHQPLDIMAYGGYSD